MMRLAYFELKVVIVVGVTLCGYSSELNGSWQGVTCAILG